MRADYRSDGILHDRPERNRDYSWMLPEYGNPPICENMRGVLKTFDGGDIDDNGHWCGAVMCCLECRETSAMRLGITATYLLAEVECGGCGEVFAEYWI